MKKIISLIVALTMIFCAMPVFVFAESESPVMLKYAASDFDDQGNPCEFSITAGDDYEGVVLIDYTEETPLNYNDLDGKFLFLVDSTIEFDSEDCRPMNCLMFGDSSLNYEGTNFYPLSGDDYGIDFTDEESFNNAVFDDDFPYGAGDIIAECTADTGILDTSLFEYLYEINVRTNKVNVDSSIFCSRLTGSGNGSLKIDGNTDESTLLFVFEELNISDNFALTGDSGGAFLCFGNNAICNGLTLYEEDGVTAREFDRDNNRTEGYAYRNGKWCFAWSEGYEDEEPEPGEGQFMLCLCDMHYGGEVLFSNGDPVDFFTPYEYDSDTELTIIPPENCESEEAIVALWNKAEDTTTEIRYTYGDDPFTFPEGLTDGVRLYIWWDEESCRFDNIDYDEETEKVIFFVVDGDGYISFDESDEDIHATYYNGNCHKLIVDKEMSEISCFLSDPGKLWNVQYFHREEDRYDDYDGATLEGETLTFPIDDYFYNYRIVFEGPVRVFFDFNPSFLTAYVNDEAIRDHCDYWIDKNDAVLSYEMKDGYELHTVGLYYGELGRSAYPSDFFDEDCCHSFADDPNCESYYIVLATEEDCWPRPCEFFAQYDGWNDAAVLVDGKRVDERTLYPYVADETLSIDFVPPVGADASIHVIIQNYDTDEEVDLSDDVKDNHVSYRVPADNNGLCIQVWWDDYSFCYDNIRPENGEKLVNVRWDGSSDIIVDADLNNNLHSVWYNGNSLRALVDERMKELTVTFSDPDKYICAENWRGEVLGKTTEDGYVIPLNLNYDTDFFFRFERERTVFFDYDENAFKVYVNGKAVLPFEDVPVELGNTYITYEQIGDEALHAVLYNTDKDYLYSPSDFFNGTGGTHLIDRDGFDGDRYYVRLAKEWEGYLLNNEYRVSYSQRDGASVKVNGQRAEDGRLFSFSSGDELNVQLLPPDCNAGNVHVRICRDSSEPVDITESVKNNSFTYLIPDNEGFSIEIWWTDDEYDFDTTNYFENGNASQLELDVSPFGTVSFNGVYSDSVSNPIDWKYRVKYEIPRYYSDLVLSFNGEIEYLEINGQFIPLDSSEIDYVNHTITVPSRTFGENVYVRVDFAEPARLHFHVNPGDVLIKDSENRILESYTDIYLDEYESCTVTFTSINEDNKIKGIQYFANGEPFYALADKNGTVVWQVPDLTKCYDVAVCYEWDLLANDFRIEADCYGETCLYSGNKEIDFHRTYSFTPGETISIRVIDPDGNGSVYKAFVEVYQNGAYSYETDVTSSIDENGSYSFVGVAGEAYRVKIFWSEEEYNYDRFWYSDGNILVDIDCEKLGTLTLANSYLASARNDSNDGWSRVRYELEDSENAVVLNFTGDIRRLEIEGMDIPLDSEDVIIDMENGTITVPRYMFGDQLHVHIEFKEPARLHFHIDPHDVLIKDSANKTLESYTDIYLEGYESCTVTFTSINRENKIKGIQYFADGEPFYALADENGTVVWQIPDLTKCYDVAVCYEWDLLVNEFRIEADTYGDTRLYSGNEELDFHRTYSFTPGETISIRVINPDGNGSVYKAFIEVFENGAYSYETDVTDMFDGNGTFSSTTVSNEAYRLRIFWTEEEYNYDRFQYSDDSILIELDYEKLGSLALAGSYLASARNDSNDGWSRVRYEIADSDNSVVLNFEGELFRFEIDGMDIPLDSEDVMFDFENGTVAIPRNMFGDRLRVHVEFREPQPAGLFIVYVPYMVSVTDSNNEQVNPFVPIDIASLDSYELTFVAKPGYGPIQGISIAVNGERDYVLADENGVVTWRIDDCSKWYDVNPVFVGDLFINDYSVGAEIYDGAEIKINDEIVDPYTVYSFDTDDNLKIEVTKPSGVESIYSAYVEISYKTGYTHTIDLTGALNENGVFTVSTRECGSYRFCIFWDKESFDYDNFFTPDDCKRVEIVVDGPIDIIWFNLDNWAYEDLIIYNNKIKFNVKQDVEVVDFAATILSGGAVDSVFFDGEDVPFTVKNGVLTFSISADYLYNDVRIETSKQTPVAEPLLGDLNCDGKINAVDLNMMTALVLGKLQATDAIMTAADMNRDNRVNAIDTSIIVNKIIG